MPHNDDVLEFDRRCAMIDAQGDFVNAKREGAFQGTSTEHQVLRSLRPRSRSLKLRYCSSAPTGQPYFSPGQATNGSAALG